MSFISTIESGLNHTRDDKPLAYYSQKSDVYQLPIWDVDGGVKSSSTEKIRFNNTVENQLIGAYRGHLWAGMDGYGIVIRNGAFTDKSNQQQNFLIGSISGTELLLNDIYLGDRYNVGKELIFSGLLNAGTSYLWGSLVEENPQNLDFQSSRQFTDIAPIITNSSVAPNDSSIFLGTYRSGTGFSNAMVPTFTTVKQHVDNNQDPHGPYLNQSGINVFSGIYIYNSSQSNNTIPTVDRLKATNYNYNQSVQVFQTPTQTLSVQGDLYNLNQTLSGTSLTSTVVTSSELVMALVHNAAAIGTGVTTSDPQLVSNALASTIDSRAHNACILSRVIPTGGFITADASGASQDVFDIATLLIKKASPTVPVEIYTYFISSYNGITSSVSIPNNVHSPTTTALVLVGLYVIGADLISGLTVDIGGIPMALLYSNTILVGPNSTDLYIYTLSTTGGLPGGLSSLNINYTGTADLLVSQLSFNNVDQSTPYASFGFNDPNGVSSVSIPEPAGAGSFQTILNTLYTLSGSFTNATLGTLKTTSGLDIYGNSLFRNQFQLSSGVPLDGLQVPLLSQFTNNTCVSGTGPSVHIHSPHEVYSGTSVKLSPKYKDAFTNSRNFTLGFDLNSKNTLKHNNNFYPEDYWVRGIVPPGCNKLDSIQIESKIDTGCTVDVTIYDCLGAEQDPSTGGTLRPSASLVTTIISGVDQSGFTQRMPFDIKLTFNTSGAGVHLLGDITMNFLSNP